MLNEISEEESLRLQGEVADNINYWIVGGKYTNALAAMRTSFECTLLLALVGFFVVSPIEEELGSTVVKIFEFFAWLPLVAGLMCIAAVRHYRRILRSGPGCAAIVRHRAGSLQDAAASISNQERNLLLALLHDPRNPKNGPYNVIRVLRETTASENLKQWGFLQSSYLRLQTLYQTDKPSSS